MKPTLSQLEDRYAVQMARGVRPMRRIVLHIGPHKTGSTFIQRMAEHNAITMPIEYAVIPRSQLELEVVKSLIRRAKTEDEMIAAAPAIRTHARALGRLCLYADCTLISHEDVLGAVPATRSIKGLYPFHGIALRAVYDGLTDSGASVECYAYRRPIADWLRSHYRYVNKSPLPEKFAVRAYARRLDFPFNWDRVFTQLSAALPDGRFHELSFQDERDTAFLGYGIYRAMGMTDADIAALTRINPQRITDPTTANPT